MVTQGVAAAALLALISFRSAAAQGRTYEGEEPMYEGEEPRPMPMEGQPPMPAEAMMTPEEEQPEGAMASPGPRPPCRCERVWRWMSKTYRGCSRTPDFAQKLWCMSEGGERCVVATASTMASGRYWMECPYEHWIEEGGWDMEWAEGATNYSSMGKWMKEAARGSKDTPHGHQRMALRGSYTKSKDAAEAPKSTQGMARSARQQARMNEHTAADKQDWMASVYTERDTDHKSKKKVHNGVQYTDTKGKQWVKRGTKVTKKIIWYQQRIPAGRGSPPAEQIREISHESTRKADRLNKELEAFIDCPFWKKMLGYKEACMKAYQLQDHGTHGERPGRIVV